MKFCFWYNEVEIALEKVAKEPELTESSAATRLAPNICSIDEDDICYGLRNITNPIDLEGSRFLRMPSFD